ncbi:putative mitochondrial phosphate carrier protein Pic2/Mir1 [Helianthus debilis subsp. tardiflorus]
MFLYSSSSSSKYLIQFEHLIAKPPNCWTSSLSTSDLGSASTELIAGIALCPFEAVRVCVQTNPGFAKSISDSFLNFINAKGTPGYDCRV